MKNDNHTMSIKSELEDNTAQDHVAINFPDLAKSRKRGIENTARGEIPQSKLILKGDISDFCTRETKPITRRPFEAFQYV